MAGGNTSIQLLAYADDITLVIKEPQMLHKLLDISDNMAGWCGLTFKPAKCATLHHDCRKGRKITPTTFRIQQGSPAVLKEGESYRHLGVPTGFKVEQTPLATVDTLMKDATAIDESFLAPWQKIDAVSTFLIPRLDCNE